MPQAVSFGESPHGPGSDLAQPGTPEFSAVLLRTDPVAGRHLDAAHGLTVVGLPPDRLASMARTCHIRGTIPRQPVLAAGGRRRRAVQQTPSAPGHAGAVDDPGVWAGDPGFQWRPSNLAAAGAEH